MFLRVPYKTNSDYLVVIHLACFHVNSDIFFHQIKHIVSPVERYTVHPLMSAHARN
jgi:hypothetical protein